MEKKMNDICEMKNRIITMTQHCLENPANVDVHVMGEMVDMVKDLYEAEKDCWKACYYRELVCEMQGERGSERYGYDNYRYRSGRFAPKGHGHYAGYNRPIMDGDDMMPEYDGMRGGNRRYGYRPYMMDDKDLMTPYDQFMESRRHYHETKSPDSKREMEMHAKEHVEEAISSFHDIWDESSPELRKEMKKNLTNLVNTMTV